MRQVSGDVGSVEQECHVRSSVDAKLTMMVPCFGQLHKGVRPMYATSRICGWLMSAPGRLSIENMMWKCMPNVWCTIPGEEERLCQYIPEVQTKLSPTELTSLHKGCRRSEADRESECSLSPCDTAYEEKQNNSSGNGEDGT
jgi:hypothetical protein